MPLPASFLYGSALSCGPTAETGYEYDVRSFDTQPSIGIVKALLTPAAALSWTNFPAAGDSRFSKNQSLPELQASISWLYVEARLPPQRDAVAPSCAVVA